MILRQSHAPGGGAPAATSHLKVWPLADTASGELRFVLLNRHPTQAATQVVRLEGARGRCVAGRCVGLPLCGS